MGRAKHADRVLGWPTALVSVTSCPDQLSEPAERPGGGSFQFDRNSLFPRVPSKDESKQAGNIPTSPYLFICLSISSAVHSSGLPRGRLTSGGVTGSLALSRTSWEVPGELPDLLRPQFPRRHKGDSNGTDVRDNVCEASGKDKCSTRACVTVPEEVAMASWGERETMSQYLPVP